MTPIDKPSELALRKDTEENRRRIEVLAADMAVLKLQYSTLTEDLDEKHNQNRRDIHAVRNAVQSTTDKVFETLGELKDDLIKQIHDTKLTAAKDADVKELSQSLHNMQVSNAKFMGKLVGGSIALGALVSFGLRLLEYYITKH